MTRVASAAFWLPVWAALLAGCGSASADPSGDADVVIEALDMDFDADTYRVAAGPVTIELLQRDNERHTLVLEGPDDIDVPGFGLSVGGGTGDRDIATVDLAAGTYLLYCDVPGHRAAGMFATLTVEETP